jgi:hypothetical protein
MAPGREGNPTNNAKSDVQEAFVLAYLAKKQLAPNEKNKKEAHGRWKRELGFGGRLQQLLKTFNVVAMDATHGGCSPGAHPLRWTKPYRTSLSVRFPNFNTTISLSAAISRQYYVRPCPLSLILCAALSPLTTCLTR